MASAPDAEDADKNTFPSSLMTQAFYAMTQGAVLISVKGRILNVNRAAGLLLGVTEQYIKSAGVASPMFELMRSDGTVLPRDNWPCREALRTQQPCQVRDVHCRRPDGSVVRLDMTASPLTDDTGRCLGVLTTVSRASGQHGSHPHAENELYRSIVEDQTEMICRFKADGKFTFVNEAYCRHFDIDRERALHGTWVPFVHKADRARVQECVDKLSADNPLGEIENRVILADGSVRWHHWRNRAILDEQGRIESIQAVGRDITERVHAEQMVNDLNQQIEYILGATGTGLDIIDDTYTLRYVDREWRARYGPYKGKKCYAYYQGRKDVCPGCGIAEAKRTGKRIVSTQKLLKEDRTVQVMTIPFTSPTGEKLFAEVNVDITDRLRLEKEVLEATRLEQRRIGRSWHESLGQQLVGIAFLLKALEARLKDKHTKEACDVFKILGLVNEAREQARGIIRGLAPVDIEAEGLCHALEQLALNTRRVYGIKCTCVLADPPEVRDDSLADNLYCIAAEAVNNACRHAGPTRIAIRLSMEQEQGCLQIKDNGIGLKQDRDKNKGFGLRLMQYRAHVVGGQLQIGTRTLRGTKIKCIFPVTSKT